MLRRKRIAQELETSIQQIYLLYELLLKDMKYFFLLLDYINDKRIFISSFSGDIILHPSMAVEKLGSREDLSTQNGS